MNRPICNPCRQMAVIAFMWAVLAGGAPDERALPATPIWHDSLTDAVVEEGHLHRPMFLFFGAGDRTWDVRMREEVLTDSALAELFSKFTCVRLDTTSNEAAANRYGVKSTPVVLVISPGGRERARSAGFAGVNSLRSFLLKALGPRGGSIVDRQLRRLLKENDEKKRLSWSDQEWLQVLLAMGEPRHRDLVRGRLLDATPFPLQKLVSLLEHPLLAVRCAAIELLEERTGRNFGFDPWRLNAEISRSAIDEWRSFELTEDLERSRYATLAETDVERLVDELVSEQPEPASRAMRRLLRGGMSSVAVLNRYLRKYPDLPAGIQRRIRMVTFAATLQKAEKLRPEQCAHKLIFGSLDTRLAAIGSLGDAGEGGIAVLRDLLHESDPLIREAAADALAEAGGSRVVKVLAEHLDSESDVDVVVAIARCLGDTRTRRSMLVLTQMLEQDEEDVVIAALRALAKFRNRQIITKPLRACLRHQSWRIRAAAVECLANLPPDDRPDMLYSLLTDSDAFVRSVVLKTLSPERIESMKPKLLEAYAQHKDSRAAILAILAAGGDIPPSIARQLPQASGETLQQAISLLSERRPSLSTQGSKKRDAAAVREAIRLLANSATASDNASVRLAGYTTLARAADKDGVARHLVIQVLNKGPENLRAAILRDLKIQPLPSLRYSALAEANAASPASEGEQAVDELLGAFGEDGEKDQGAEAPAGAAPPADNVAELMDAFGGEEGDAADRPEEEEKSSLPTATISELHAAVQKLLTTGTQRERVLAAVQLLRMQDPEALGMLTENAAEIPVELAVKLGPALQALKKVPGSKDLALALLRSPDPRTRQKVCNIILQDLEPASWLRMMIHEVIDAEQPLTAKDAFSSYQLMRVMNDANKAATLRSFAQYIHEHGKNAPLKRLALYLNVGRPEKTAANRSRSLLNNPDTTLRRLAWILLANADFDEFARRSDTLAKGDDPAVQRLVPEMILQLVEVNLFEHSQRLPNEVAQLLARRVRFRKDDFRSLLRLLSAPPHGAEVRVLALLASIRLGEDISSAQVEMALQDLEKPADFLRRIPFSVRRHLARTSSDVAAVLARHLGNSDMGSDGFLKRKEGSVKIAEEAKNLPPAVRHVTRRQMEATNTSQVSTTPYSSSTPQTSTETDKPTDGPRQTTIHLFTTPGCADCDEIQGLLESLEADDKHLELRVHNVNTPEAASFNQTLSSRFSLSKELHLNTPAVFSAAGVLVGKQATPQAVYDLALQSPWTTTAEPDWDKPAKTVASEPTPSPGKEAVRSERPTRPRVLLILSAMTVTLLCLLLVAAFITRRRHGSPN